MILAFENGTKLPPNIGATEHCDAIANTSLISLRSAIVDAISPCMKTNVGIWWNKFPPFATFLIYKAAAITTERLVVGRDSNEELATLRLLRKVLELVATRWLGAGKLFFSITFISMFFLGGIVEFELIDSYQCARSISQNP